MTIEWTGYARIKLDNGIDISVNSETPGSTSAHSKVVDAGQVPCSEVTEADPKAEEPAGNPPAPMDESKPRLLIDIAKSTDSSERAMKVISLTFRHMYEAFDRDEERAMAFVECIGSTEFKGGEGSLHGQRPGGGRV